MSRVNRFLLGIFVLFFAVNAFWAYSAYGAGSNPAGQGSNPAGQGQNPGPPSASIENPLKVDSITGFLVAVIQVILVFAIPIIVLYIMYAGFLFVTANGEPGQLEKARNALLFALIGGVIILGAFAIINIIKGTVNNITEGTVIQQ